MYKEYQNGVNIEKMNWYDIQHIINNWYLLLWT
jgi:hypothetical protein